jgi:hypothetical protein
MADANADIRVFGLSASHARHGNDNAECTLGEWFQRERNFDDERELRIRRVKEAAQQRIDLAVLQRPGELAPRLAQRYSIRWILPLPALSTAHGAAVCPKTGCRLQTGSRNLVAPTAERGEPL